MSLVVKSSAKAFTDKVVKDIRRHVSSEDQFRMVLDGLFEEDRIAEFCRKEGVAQSLYYTWSKELMEAGRANVLTTDTKPARTIKRP